MRTMQPVKYTFDVILPEILLRVIVGTFNITRDEVLMSALIIYFQID